MRPALLTAGLLGAGLLLAPPAYAEQTRVVDLALHVRDVAAADATVGRLVGASGGLVLDRHPDPEARPVRSSLDLSVPTARLEELLAGMAVVGTVEEQQVTTHDERPVVDGLRAQAAEADRLVQVLATVPSPGAGPETLERARQRAAAAHAALRDAEASRSRSTVHLLLTDGSPAPQHVMEEGPSREELARQRLVVVAALAALAAGLLGVVLGAALPSVRSARGRSR